MDTLPPEIITILYSYARSPYELLRFSIIDKRSLNIVRNNDWLGFEMYLFNHNIQPIMRDYKFANITICPDTDIGDYNFTHIKKLRIYTSGETPLDITLLRFPNITELCAHCGTLIDFDFPKQLPHCDDITLHNCVVSDDCFLSIRKCKSLYIDNSYPESKNIIEFFKTNPECRDINIINEMYNFNPAKIYPYLSECRVISLLNMERRPIPYFPKCRILSLEVINLTLDILKQYCETLHEISLVGITPASWFPYLGRIKRIRLYSAIPFIKFDDDDDDSPDENYTSADFMNLANCERISLDGFNIPADFLQSLTKVKTLELGKSGIADIGKLSDTLKELTLTEYVFDLNTISDYPHLTKLTLRNSTITGDYNMISRLNEFIYDTECDVDVNELERVKTTGVFIMCG